MYYFEWYSIWFHNNNPGVGKSQRCKFQFSDKLPKRKEILSYTYMGTWGGFNKSWVHGVNHRSIYALRLGPTFEKLFCGVNVRGRVQNSFWNGPLHNVLLRVSFQNARFIPICFTSNFAKIGYHLLFLIKKGYHLHFLRLIYPPICFSSNFFQWGLLHFQKQKYLNLYLFSLFTNYEKWELWLIR